MVVEGDTLWKIAEELGLDFQAVLLAKLDVEDPNSTDPANTALCFGVVREF